jgi:hypothetical protein
MFIDHPAIYGFIAPEERNVYRGYIALRSLDPVVIGVAINTLLLRSLMRLVAALSRSGLCAYLGLFSAVKL